MKRKILRKTRIVTILSALVVFLTVYSLVLPAVALTDDKADEDPGINTSETTNVAEVEKLSLNEETSSDVEIETTEQAEEEIQKEEIKEEKKVVENVSYPAVSFSDSLGDMIVYVEAPEGAFPENTQMQLKEVEDEAALVDSINSNLENKEVKAIKAVDITFIYNNEELEPLKPIKVSMTSSFIESNKEDEQLLVHVDNDNNTNIVETTEVKEKDVEVINNVEEVQTLVENTNEINEITTDNTVAFESDAFSVYAVVYTVDFEYETEGGTYKYSLPGEGTVSLSELIEALGIINDTKYENTEDFISQIKDVKFSNDSLIRITQNENDWLLESLASFDTEEKLIISTNNNVIYIVKVTDPATQNISSLLTDVKINATQNSDGSYTVYAGQAYGIDLSFKEQPSGTQFDMADGFYYPIPAGLFDTDVLTGKAMIELSGGDHAGESVELDYRVEGNNIVFSWPDQTSGAYEQLKNALYTNFKIHIEAKFNESATEIKFNDDIKKVVDVKTDGKAEVQKTGTYNPKTNSIDYVVNVTSTGICKNVVVTDTISGTALTYNNDAVATSNKGTAVPAPTASGNGFTFTIPQMGDGETVTVKYSAAVNLDALTQNEDGTLGTVEQTGNKVKVTPSNHPGDEDETSGKDFNNKISYSTISKSSSVGKTGEDGHATVTWTIKANENANVSMAGHTISDLIDAGSQSIMKYNGAGITITRRDSSGNVVGSSETIFWDSLTSHSDSAWTWTIPNSAPDTGKLSYEITYTTDVDVNGKLFNTTVKNTGTSDNGGSSSGSGDVGPAGGPLAARKVYISKDMTGEEKTVTWEVNFDVPAGGLDSAVIDDTLPSFWNGSSVIVDAYKKNSIVITEGLAFGESYEISTYKDDAKKDHLVITFHKTVDEHKLEGLSGTGTKRKIRVQFKTILNPDWLEIAKTNPNAITHTNNANVILNGQKLETQASVRIDVTEPEMSKTHNSETVNVVNNNTLPAWQFFITLSGVSDETFDENGQIVIADTYNSKYLDWYPHAYESWEKQNGQVYGGNSNDKFVESSNDKVMSKISDGQLKIVLNQADLPLDDNGEYYQLYTIPYYLTVKDPIAYQKLITTAANTDGGSIALYNTVTNDIFGETEDRVDYEVPVVNKTATEPALTNGVYKLHYTIDVNSRALQLGDSDELVMTDEYSNISIDYTTLKIYKVVNGQKIEVKDVVWDRSGYVSTYYFKNATHYVVEYDAHLSGEGERISDTQSELTYTNTAEAFGKKSTWEKTKTIDQSSSGGSRTYGVKVLKHVKGNASQGLSGAVFELWMYPATADDPNGKNNRPNKDDPGWVNTGKTLTTDLYGYAKTSNDMQIHSQTWYKLIEVTAPQGYVLKTTHYFFWITEDQIADYSKYVYINDDVLAINNTPELPETVNITVEKVWNDNGDSTLRKDVSVHLYAEGVPYNEYYSGEWADKARKDADVTLHLKEDGTSETYTWKGLPSGNTYSVVEDPVPGYVTSYSPKNTLVNGTLTITNKRNTQKTAISVEKEWKTGTKPTEDVTIQLKRYVSLNAPVVIQNGANGAGPNGLHITDYSYPANSTIKLIWTWKSGWSLDTPGLNIYNFKTKELITHLDEISGTSTEHFLEVKLPSDGIIVAFEKPYLDSLAAFESAYDFDVKVVSSGEGKSVEDTSFTNERHLYTLKPDQNWRLDIDNLMLSDTDGAYTYFIEEIGVNDNTQTLEEAGLEVTYTNNSGIAHGSIKAINEKEPPAKIQVTKVFDGINALPEGFRITNDYNDAVFTVTNAIKGNGTASSPYTWLIDEIPAGTEVEFTESGVSAEGYSLTITANGTALPEGSTTASASGTAAKASVDGSIPTVTFVNEYEKEEQIGSLDIQKNVMVGNNPPTEKNKSLVRGTYTFEIASTELHPEVKKTINITFDENGEVSGATVDGTAIDLIDGKARISGLTAGTYTVKESSVSNGSVLIGVSVTEGAGSVSDNIATVNVTANNTASIPVASFTNNVETVSASVEKKWEHGKNTDRPVSLEVILSNGTHYTLNEGNGWKTTVSDLPKKDAEGNVIVYSWSEGNLPAGYYLSNISENTDKTTGNISTVLTNTFTDHYMPETTIKGKKIWDDGGINRPSSITVNLFKDGGTEPYRHITVNAPTDDPHAYEWPFEFANLPVFNVDGSIIEYTVQEVLPDGYSNVYGISVVFEQATYIAGDITGTIVNSGKGGQIFKVSEDTSLGYIVIRHGNDFVLWTPRPATTAEINDIKKKVVDLSNQFNGIKTATGNSMRIISGVPNTIDVGNKNAVSVYMQNGQVWMKFLNPNAWSDFAYGTIPYTYTQAGGEGGGTITNTKKLTDFHFGKKWLNTTRQEIDWDNDIQLTVARNKANGEEDDSFSLVYNIQKSTIDSATSGTVDFDPEDAEIPKLKLTINSVDNKKTYSFELNDLPYLSEDGEKYTYYVIESNARIDGYLDPEYSNESAPTGATAAYDGGTIINKQKGGPELPHTGGPGDTMIKLLGTVIMFAAIVTFLERKKRK